ncbi:MAG TPA: SDR family oxidoreductase [Gammaproteobacteria bacterium]|nr:SDR family oxidoreductase [Gammaproteobacteria bacterium]
MNSVLIAGCGDIGQRVARLYRAQGASVRGLARSESSAARLRAGGIEPVFGDLAKGATLKNLPTAEAVLFYFAPPPAQGERDPLLQNFLAAIGVARRPAKLVLISTTAVYGDCRGVWITEAQAVQPQTARGRRRLDAENTLRCWGRETGVPFVILRVGGIYGPGRLPVARLEKGLPILDPVESPQTNRIHQDDLAQVCVAAMERGVPGEVYNIADGHPGTMSQYFIDVAKALGLPPPPVVPRAEAEKVMSAGMLSYLQESRRLDNRKMREELAVELRYPDLAAGLAALQRN